MTTETVESLGSTRADARGGLGLRFDDVRMHFGTPGDGLEALRDCSFEVAAGSFTVVIGPNGSGKSTLLRLAAGLLSPTSGRVTVGARPPRAGDGHVGIGFQQPRLVPWRSTRDNVALALELADVPTAQRRSRALIAMQRVGLSGAADLMPRELSGGMQQRAALGRALVTDPEVLLLDEPFSALDALTRERFNVELQQLWAERPLTILLVTHSVPEAIQLADRVLVMTARPGGVVTSVEVDLPRPRPADVMSDPVAAARAADVRAALESSGAEELRPWTQEQAG
ncbi:MAG: ABC transporter ATP-binding protein [Candidatus Limnocylindria bacterium]